MLLYLDSRWILAHYRPLLVSHGRTIYALPGARPVSSLHLHLHQQPVTTGVPFLGQQCTWAMPHLPQRTRRAPVRRPDSPRAQRSRAPGPGHLHRLGGRPAGTAARSRSDRHVQREDHRPIDPRYRPPRRPRGRLSHRVPPQRISPRDSHLGERIAGAEDIRDRPEWLGRTDRHPDNLHKAEWPASGVIPSACSPMPSPATSTRRSPQAHWFRSEPPAGTRWSDYRWLEVDAPSFGGFLPGTFELSDQPDATDPGHTISFDTLANSPRRYIIPVSSCQQWRGYGSSPLFLISSPSQEIGGVRLIR